MGDGFAVHVSTSIYNSFISQTKVLPIFIEKEELEIETLTFKDKIQPDRKETWSFTIHGKDHLAKEAEVLASMYDASLDQFKPHQWNFNPIRQGYYSGTGRINGHLSYGQQSFLIANQRSYSYPSNTYYYDRLDWFGFNLGDNYYIRNQYLQRLYPDPTHAGASSKVMMSSNRNLEEGIISGKVISSDGNSLPGVSILVKGTTRGTVTNEDGKYSLRATKDETLVFSFIGYSTAEAKISKRNSIDVIMEEDIMALSEVIVVGYGVQMKRDITGSVATVATSTIDPFSDVVLTEAAQGKVSGVQLTGSPGGDVNVYIRGSASLGNSSAPLYVVDGEIVDASKIEMSDLESITVLKNETATSLYGSRAANGAIIITTKSGQRKLDEEMAKVNIRKNFNETAFFFPHLKTDENGRINFTFTSPESLSRWKLQLLAHTKDLATSVKTMQAVTQKEMMVSLNAPRFLRVGDEVFFSVKIASLTSKPLNGKAFLQLTNASNGESLDIPFGNVVRNQLFKLPAKGSVEIHWKLKVPVGCEALQYKIVAKAGNFSDGEQNILPVLSNKILITETMPMFLKGGQTKEFNLEKLKTSTSPTLEHHRLTFEITSNPVWIALQSLPYLIEFPHECAEQTFSRYYANALGSHILNSHPEIKAVFDQWSSSDQLISNLEKNQELKSIIIQETPWLREAQSEAEQKKRMAQLFDLSAIKSLNESVIAKLEDMQLGNGSFPWFSGSDFANEYITRHIASSYGHLKHLGVVDSTDGLRTIIANAVAYLDKEIIKEYQGLKAQAQSLKEGKSPSEGLAFEWKFMENEHISNDEVHYLYMRSFYPEIKQGEGLKEVIRYFMNQSAKYWKSFSLYNKGMIALTHYRTGNKFIAKEILESLKESSIVSEEFGMYWKANSGGWYWYEAPLETQALMIEAFSEIELSQDQLIKEEKKKTIDELKTWLLKNKQTNRWRTTKATTEAIYALLLNNDSLTSVDEVEITIAGTKINPSPKQAEEGVGYFKTSWEGKDVKPEMSAVKLAKKTNGIAWAGLYWQYFEELDNVTPAETPLKLVKKVFKVENTDQGSILSEINTGGTINVGDLLRVRIELKADRHMEFLHMKDMRASCLEPVDVLSGYKWQDNLSYYQSNKDASTNFFFDEVEKGVYVFEYDLRVNNKGNFTNGITTIQSMYAPEFSSHSEGMRIEVK
jgi:TonB-dependent SusC/RagA subfamily outer membrane receptor